MITKKKASSNQEKAKPKIGKENLKGLDTKGGASRVKGGEPGKTTNCVTAACYKTA